MINRTIIGKKIAHELGVTQKLGRRAVGIMLEEMIAGALARGENVALMGFGTFALQQWPARPKGRNPFTGAPMAIPASVGVRFRAHAALKAALNPEPARKVGGDRNSPMPQRRRA
jgi:DNA-binding protein HU-beta